MTCLREPAVGASRRYGFPMDRSLRSRRAESFLASRASRDAASEQKGLWEPERGTSEACNQGGTAVCFTPSPEFRGRRFSIFLRRK